MTDTPKPQHQTHVVESKDGSIKITRPKDHKHHVTVLFEPDELREQATGFVSFLREYAVVGLAVGFIVGQQANGVAKQLVDSFINPWIQIVFGEKLSTQTATFHHGITKVPVPWGAFVYALIQFFVILLAIYVLIKLLRLDKFRKK